MAFFGLFAKKELTVDVEERDYSRVAVPDPHMPDGQAPYIDAWTGYAPARMKVRPSELHTVGREPRQVAGEYPASEMASIEDPEWKVAPQAEQTGWVQGDDPRWTALKKPALRVQRAPTTYRVSHPFDWEFAHHLNGQHFSMADNIRTYSIGGMQPAIPRRNTFRLTPPPHDVNQANVRGNQAFDVNDMDMKSPVSAWRSPVARLGG